MAHLLGIDPHDRAEISFRRGRIEQFALEFHGGEFRVSLDGDES